MQLLGKRSLAGFESGDTGLVGRHGNRRAECLWQAPVREQAGREHDVVETERLQLPLQEVAAERLNLVEKPQVRRAELLNEC